MYKYLILLQLILLTSCGEPSQISPRDVDSKNQTVQESVLREIEQEVKAEEAKKNAAAKAAKQDKEIEELLKSP
ncbi:hypothetical protein PQO03_06695 [Lentisphaera profundi]|uniref:Lipoprotein n=1 Tax=Lentisphaera profundi TaxID=1658616 RepID=A0ABY7VNY4_9BACT|nr:hypothetical protein [Lentisphaera profundi]WDE95404.1 hypothetical protein PQO03_06695 [Lentisphaera profundi]